MKSAPPLLLLMLFATGCESVIDDPAYSSCRAMATRDWSAQIVVDKPALFPFPEESRLVVSGTVQVPTGGFDLSIEPGPVVRLEPPVQQVILRTKAPDDMATQAIVEQKVTGSLPYDPRAKSVSVRCGDGTIAEIPMIEDQRGKDSAG